MSSLFGRLFRYKASENRRPLEDFLSEALAGFFNQAPPEEAHRLFATCFLPRHLWSLWHDVLSNKHFYVKTQVRLPSGKKIDILAECDSQPLVVVENKIWAAYQMHKLKPATANDANEDEVQVRVETPLDAEHQNQLVTYGEWLAKAQKPENWPGVLTLITHGHRAPLDFVSQNLMRYHSLPHQIQWRQVHAEFRKQVGANSTIPKQPSWQFVGEELCSFLEENDMNSADLDSLDIAAINVAKHSLSRMTTVFNELRAELLRRHPEQLLSRGQGDQANGDHGFFWGWLYLKAGGKRFVACGIKFAPAESDNFVAHPPLPPWDHAFVALGTDAGSLNLKFEDLPPGWHYVDWCCLKPFSLEERKVGERMAEFFLRLVEGEWETLEAINRLPSR